MSQQLDLSHIYDLEQRYDTHPPKVAGLPVIRPANFEALFQQAEQAYARQAGITLGTPTWIGREASLLLIENPIRAKQYLDKNAELVLRAPRAFSFYDLKEHEYMKRLDADSGDPLYNITAMFTIGPLVTNSVMLAPFPALGPDGALYERLQAHHHIDPKHMLFLLEMSKHGAVVYSNGMTNSLKHAHWMTMRDVQEGHMLALSKAIKLGHYNANEVNIYTTQAGSNVMLPAMVSNDPDELLHLMRSNRAQNYGCDLIFAQGQGVIFPREISGDALRHTAFYFMHLGLNWPWRPSGGEFTGTLLRQEFVEVHDRETLTVAGNAMSADDFIVEIWNRGLALNSSSSKIKELRAKANA